MGREPNRKSAAKHVRISNELRSLIQAGTLAVGDAIPPEHALTRQFRCSRGTVRQAVNTLVAEGLVERRWGAGNFVTERRIGTSGKLIAMIAQNLANAERARLAQAFAAEAQERGCAMLLHVTEYPVANYDPDSERRFIDRLHRMGVAGVVKFPNEPSLERELRGRLRRTGIPFVILNDFWTDCRDEHHVAFDECAAMDMAIQHLADLGHERIAYVGERALRAKVLLAYHQGMEARGLHDGEELVNLSGHVMASEQGTTLFGEGCPNPTGIIFLYENKALPAIDALSQIDLRVPEDVSIVNLNGPPVHGPEGCDLTTAVPPDDAMAAKALDIVAGTHDENVVCHYLLKPGFHVGRTTAPAPAVAQKDRD